MIKDALAAINSRCQLKVLKVNWDGYNLNLVGYGWNFNSISSWRLINQSGLWGSMDDESVNLLKGLENESILKAMEFNSNGIDISFALSNETELQVFSNTYYEPWIFRFENDKTFVATYLLT